MNPIDLKIRTKDFAVRIIKLYSSLPKLNEFQLIGKQFARSGTSVGAQYREGKRAKSAADMISKFEGVLQELEETEYWLELLVEIDKKYLDESKLLMSEPNELKAIFIASVRTIKAKKQR